MENKVKELQKKLPCGTESFISLDEKTVLYLTGFTMNDGALFVTRDDAVLFVDFRYIEAANEEAKNCRVVMPEKNFYEEIRGIMAERGIKTLGFEENKTTVALLERQKKLLPDAEFVKCGEIITKMAEIKSEYELDVIINRSSNVISRSHIIGNTFVDNIYSVSCVRCGRKSVQHIFLQFF